MKKMAIDKTKLMGVEKVYPLNVSPYEQYMGDFQNPSVVSKVNAMIQSLHQIGRLTNETVSQWNTVMKWIVDGGMDEIAETITNEKVSVALNEVMRMLDVSLDNGLKELAENVSDKKIDELLESGQFESMIQTSLVEINEVVENKLEGFNLQLVETSTRLPHREQFQVEKWDVAHLEGKTYTAFVSGANIKGKEVHVARSASTHSTDETSFYVAYSREKDGSFSRKKIGGIDYSVGDFRDPNLSILPNGYIVLTGAVRKTDGAYTNYYFVLNEDLDATYTRELVGMEGFFSWGNTLMSSASNILKLGYMPSTTQGGVKLFENVGDMQMVEIADVFPADTAKPSEATMGFWGGKLIAVTRRNSGTMLYRETNDLTGRSGWGTILDLGIIADAPSILPFTKEFSPLILTASYEDDVTFRSPFFAKLDKPRKLLSTDMVFIDKLNKRGGYNSLVPNEFGYGLMYYQDWATDTTNVYHKDVDIDKVENRVEMNQVLEKGRGFYSSGTWQPNVEIFTNITSIGTTRRAFYTVIGNLVMCNFEVQNLIPTTLGKTEIKFDLPIPRGNYNVMGDVKFLVATRDSSSYVSYFQSTDLNKCFASLEVKSLPVSGGSLIVSATYQI